MQKAKPTYIKEFKLEAVHLWQTSGKSPSQIARDLGYRTARSAIGVYVLQNRGKKPCPEVDIFLRLKKKTDYYNAKMTSHWEG